MPIGYNIKRRRIKVTEGFPNFMRGSRERLLFYCCIFMDALKIPIFALL